MNIENIENEISVMIEEVRARSGASPDCIVGSQETISNLMAHSSEVYLSADDIFNNTTGRVGRYRGIPITVDNTLEPGEFYLIPSTRDEYVERDMFTMSGDHATPYWLNGPYVTSTGVTTEPTGMYNTQIGSGWNFPFYPFETGWAPHTLEDTPDIDEDSFADILKGENADEDT